MDEFDKRILKILREDATLSLKEIGKRVGLYSPSAISKRIETLKMNGYIKKITATIDYSKMGFSFVTITLIRGKYGGNYKDVIAEKLKKIPGIVSVYFLLGDIDFMVQTVSKGKDEYSKILERISSINEIERSDTRTILQTYKEMDYGTVEI
ncbi:MAG: AsnC family transcriptional regulator [Thermoplasmatales archaeon I-plasma]|jgi:Lrp/AsnC family transcriptional regulator for asnA, asnC and gidA|nr:MAG: AsnC family transcriptional regulator [Thermoplasmatales archaeon I-plasma]MCL5929912.1 Lrp/AsnC family transcriptional regulator [Candidatus Thermoplasmatota archaeon]